MVTITFSPTNTMSEVFSVATDFPIEDEVFVEGGSTSAYVFVDSTSDVYITSGSTSHSEMSDENPTIFMDVTLTTTTIDPATQSVISYTSTPAPTYDTVSHILPPTTTKITSPSLNVLNLAKVGSLQIGDLLPAPTDIRGVDTDRQGMVRFDATDGLWYCARDFDGEEDIWKLLPFESLPPPPATSKPIGYHATYKLVGSPSDVVGEIRWVGDYAFICVTPYTGWATIWKQIMHGTFDSSKFTTTYSYGSTSAPDASYPTGLVCNYYSVLVAPKSSLPEVLFYTTLQGTPSGATYIYTPTSNGYAVSVGAVKNTFLSFTCICVYDVYGEYTAVVKYGTTSDFTNLFMVTLMSLAHSSVPVGLNFMRVTSCAGITLYPPVPW